jgi:aromatic-L-amino-acid/L-tryptophan decarboxylase
VTALSAEARATIEALRFEEPDPSFERWLEAEAAGYVDTSAARYFGLPHGTVGEAATRGAALAARLNPELATRHHAPLLAALEEQVTSVLGERLVGSSHHGIVTTGASEANLVALLLACAASSARFAREGLAALRGRPRVYVSSDAHPSVTKACRIAGFGDAAVRVVASDEHGVMIADSLASEVGQDRARGHLPLAVVATFGTTTLGALDPVASLADLAERLGLWLHVDAAYGGALAFEARTRPLAEPISRALSVAFDPPKVFDVPLGAGLLYTRRPELLRSVFGVGARYLPRAGDEPFATTPSWSRAPRLLPLAFALAGRGLVGLERVVARRRQLAERLASQLAGRGLVALHRSPLPVVGLYDPRVPTDERPRALAEAAARAQSIGAWLPLVRLPSGVALLRAAINSEATTEADLDALVDALVG